MPGTRGTYRRNSPDAAARVIAALIARDGWFDWRECEFLDRANALQTLGIERGHFMAVLSRCLGEQLGGMAAGCSSSAERFDAELDAELDAIDDRTTQLIVAAALLYLAEIDSVQCEERVLVRRAGRRWNATPQTLEREMGIPLALARTNCEPAAARA